MNIAIFEPEHFETVKALVLVFNPEQHSIAIFTNEICYDQLMPSQDQRLKQCHWVVKGANESKYRFLFRFFTQVNREKTGVLVLNTVNDNFIIYALVVRLLRSTRIILGVHDIHAYFRIKHASGFRQWVRKMGKRWLVEYVQEFNVTSTILADYLRSIIPQAKQVHCIPGAVYEARISAEVKLITSGRIDLVVAGTIDSRRRNYERVFQLLQMAEEINLSISVVLLGPAAGSYGTAILEKCRVYAQTKNNLKFYDSSLVGQPEFDHQMDLAHFIFIPSVIDTVIFDGIEEKYGLSKSSGNLSDVIKHAKPFIIPRALQVDPYLDRSCIRYESLTDILEALVLMRDEPEKYLLIRKLAMDASMCYTPENVKERNPGLFNFSR